MRCPGHETVSIGNRVSVNDAWVKIVRRKVDCVGAYRKILKYILEKLQHSHTKQ